MGFRNSNHSNVNVDNGVEPHICTVCHFQIKLLLTNRRIILIQLEKLAFLEEEYCIPEILFNFPDCQKSERILPILLFERGEIFPCAGGDVDCPWIVGFFTGTISFFVTKVKEPGISIFILFDKVFDAFFFVDWFSECTDCTSCEL